MKPIRSFSGEFRFLSNFYMVRVRHERHYYQSAEHAYQATKMRYEKDRERVARCRTPGSAKRMARSREMREDWEGEKLEKMRTIVIRKFQQHDDLRDKLLATGDRELREGNTYRCISKDCERRDIKYRPVPWEMERVDE